MAKTKNQELINLSRGEIKEIDWKPLSGFSVGNKDILSVKVVKGKSKLLIKGKSLGLSDLMLWGKGDERRQIQINVIDKRSHQKVSRIASHIQQLGLYTQINDQNIHIEGRLNEYQNYLALVRLYSDARESDVLLYTDQVEIDPKLERSVFAKFLSTLMQLNLTLLECSPKKLWIECEDIEDTSLKSSKTFLDKSYLIHWIPQAGGHTMKQFEVQLILQQFENQTGESFTLGLNRIKGNWEQVLSDSPLSLIKQNNIHIEDSEYKTSTLAQPKIIGRFHTPIKVQVGQEILYTQNLGNNMATQQWKFAGLDIDIQLTPMAKGILVKFSNSLSQPSGDSLTKSSQESSIIVEEGQSEILFDIGFQMKKNDESRFPGLSSIPLFGSLFKNKFISTSYKNVLCLIKITEI